MKENVIEYAVASDVTELECDLHDAQIKVEEAADGKFILQFPATKNIRVGNSEGTVLLKQSKRSFFIRCRQAITVKVPPHVVPDLHVMGKRVHFTAEGGIYKSLVYSADEGSLFANGCALESLDVSGGEVDVNLSSPTVKGGVYVRVAKGNVLAENAFATRTECRIKSGSIGFTQLKCKETVLETGHGNITATLDGARSAYSTDLFAKTGTISKESETREGAERIFKAYTENGNVVLDFLKSESAEDGVNIEENAGETV